MSEAKRVPLQTLEFPESLGHAAKKEKKGEKGKQLAPSFRFTLTLPESNEKACPEFNYAQLLKAAEKKRRKEQKRGDENAANGLDPFDDDDEDKLRDMARRYEAKYGTTTMGRKRHKYDDYVDLGAGYDENDSFIDNTDAYDELVPEEMTTAHGGFYINCGALEFKAADRHSLVHNNNNNNNNNEDDESSESSEEDTEDVDSPRRAEKRHVISSSDDDETEDLTLEQPRKKQKIDEIDDKKLNPENVIKKKKKQQNQQNQDQQQPTSQQQEIEILNRRKEKSETTDAEGGTASEDQDEKKKSEKTDLQKAKCISEKKFDIKKFEKKPSNSNGFDARKLDIKKLGGKDSNIDDAIESVVNAARVEDESSRDTTDSGKSRGILGTESECDDVDKEETRLPESLPEDIKEIVNNIKTHAENNKEAKSKFFNISVNSVLFSLEKKLRILNCPSVRLQTYAHLARFLPCSKLTLLNRAKKLYLQEAEYKVREPMQRLKTIIDNVMPSVLDKYVKECQKVADEKGFEGSPVDADSTDEDDSGCKNAEKSKIPKRRFPWTDESKRLVYEIANARRQYFKILRPRKESMESFVATFMDTKVLPLWPPGCVRLQTLLKYSNAVETVIKKKPKKTKDAVNVNSVTSPGNAVCNSSVKSDGLVTNTLSQDNEKMSSNAGRLINNSEGVINIVTQGNLKATDSTIDRKQHGIKNKEKIKENPNSMTLENSLAVNSSTAVGKISVVPTSQLMAQKPPKPHIEKFNLMDLTSSSLSITPVNDYQRTSGKTSETKKDVVSITAYSEPSSVLSNPNDVTQSVHFPIHRQDGTFAATQLQQTNYAVSNQTSSHSKPVPLKHRLLQENDMKSDKRLEDKDLVEVSSKADKKDKRRERCTENKHKSHDTKKRKKDHKVLEQPIAAPINPEVVPMPQQSSLSKEEQEQRQIEETVAATNFLSQIINNDIPGRNVVDKRKDNELTIEEPITASLVQPTEQEKDVQMVIRSLKELQELEEAKYSPIHSPVGGGMQKPSKSNAQYFPYQEDYHRLYIKKDDKLRPKEEPQW